MIPENLEVEYFTDLWAAAPTNVFLVRPRFRATYVNTLDSGDPAFGAPATGVQITVTDSSDIVYWDSSLMDFQAMDEAGNPILAPGVHDLWSGEVCAVRYNHNGIATLLARNGESYSIKFRYYIPAFPGGWSDWAETTFEMVTETITAIDPMATSDYTFNPPPPDHMVEGTWEIDPTVVKPITPWFRATFETDIEVSGYEIQATHVWVQVIRNSDYALVWDSGFLSFKEYEQEDNPILPNHDWVMRSGDLCEIIYQFDDNSQDIPDAMLRLPRNGASYHWRMKFYFDDINAESSWAEGNITQFLEQYLLEDPKVEGLTNPTNIIDIIPEFDINYDSVYTDWYTPVLTSYQIQVSTNIGFTVIIWDQTYDVSGTPITPPNPIPQMIYGGSAIRRNGTTYYWRFRGTVEVEWGEVITSWITTQRWTMFLEVWSASDVRTNNLVTPIIKDYYPEYTAVFSDNYSEARATYARVQVCPYVNVYAENNVRCYRFDSSDQINIGDVSALRITGNLTIDLWIKVSSTSYRTNIIDKCYYGEFATTLETNGSLSFYCGNGGSYLARNWALGMTYNNWYHVAIVRTNTSSSVKCYIAPAGIGVTHTNLGEGGTSWYNPVYVAGQPVVIGRGYTGNTYQGSVCQVRIWDKALSLSELDYWAHRETPSGTANFKGYWKLNETSGNALDFSGNGNTGTITSGPIERRSDGPLFITSIGWFADWDNLKWDSEWFSIGSMPPGSTIPVVQYPFPYLTGDSGFYWDGSKFGLRVKLTLESDGTYHTDWSESYFTMGVADIQALLPRVDGIHGTLRVRTFTPGFDAQYETDAYNDIDIREYAVYVSIQISTSPTDFTSPNLVWDSGWQELNPHLLDDLGIGIGPYSDMKILPYINPSTGNSYLTINTIYYWRIRFQNERGIIGSWSEVMQFLYVGFVVSGVSDTDIINAFWEDIEYEVYAFTKDGSIYLTVNNITEDLNLINDLIINKGMQPRLIFNSSTGMINLLFLNNTKIFIREWFILDTPETAPATAPQLIDGALDVTQILKNPLDIMDIAQRPFVPGGDPYIYSGIICDETGNIYPGKLYVVEFVIPFDHTYFYNSKTYKVYVRNGVLDGSYNDLVEDVLKNIPVGVVTYLPSSDLGCDITNSQRSKIAPWLPDLVNENIETIPRRAVYVVGSRMIVGLDTFGFDQSNMGSVSTDAHSKWTLSQTWIYKKVVYPIPYPDLFGVNESQMGSVSTDAHSKWILSQTWVYKKVVYPDEDSFGLNESQMGAMYEIQGRIHEWTVGDNMYSQYWKGYNYFSDRIR